MNAGLCEGLAMAVDGRSRIRRDLLTSLGCLTVFSLGCVLAGHATASDGHLVAVDFEHVELRIFIRVVSEATGRIFLVDDQVRGQVSIRFTNKIPVDQLYEVLESVLEVKGYAAVPAGYITKIVPLSTAKQRGIDVTGRDSRQQVDRW
jgi:type II secretory pathway component GspD/PulD (secretin)